MTQTSPVRGRPRIFPEDVAAERHREKSRRKSAATAAATRVIREMYPDIWKAAFDEAARKIDEEKGPLPGEEYVALYQAGDDILKKIETYERELAAARKELAEAQKSNSEEEK